MLKLFFDGRALFSRRAKKCRALFILRAFLAVLLACFTAACAALCRSRGKIPVGCRIAAFALLGAVLFLALTGASYRYYQTVLTGKNEPARLSSLFKFLAFRFTLLLVRLLSFALFFVPPIIFCAVSLSFTISGFSQKAFLCLAAALAPMLAVSLYFSLLWQMRYCAAEYAFFSGGGIFSPIKRSAELCRGRCRCLLRFSALCALLRLVSLPLFTAQRVFPVCIFCRRLIFTGCEEAKKRTRQAKPIVFYVGV